MASYWYRKDQYLYISYNTSRFWNEQAFYIL